MTEGMAGIPFVAVLCSREAASVGIRDGSPLSGEGPVPRLLLCR